MTSEYSCENIEFTGTLSRTSTSKGSVLAHDGTETFGIVTPAENNQILVSDSAETFGVKWTNITNIGFSITTREAVSIPAVGSDVFFLNGTDPTNPVCSVLPGSEMLCIALTPATEANGGWSDTPTNITGGTLDFYAGFVDASTATTSANFKYYATGTTTPPGTPDFQINGSSINTSGTNFSSFLEEFTATVTSGQQVSIRLDNNLTTSGAPGFNEFQAMIIFKTT